MTKIKTPAEALERFFSESKPEGVVSVYLFGSHSAGRAHRDSDVDVAVLLDWKSYSSRRHRFRQRLKLSAALMGVLACKAVDVVVLNDAPPTLGAKIIQTGRRISCFSFELDRAFARDVQLRSADLAPFLKRTRRIKLGVLQQ